MTDPVLSMRRYWGSDVSDLSDNDQADAKLKAVLVKAKKRKHESEISKDSSISAASVIEEITLSGGNVAQSPVHKSKKRKKCSTNDLPKNTVEHSSENITGSPLNGNSTVSHELSPHKVKKLKHKNLPVTKINNNTQEVLCADNTDNSNSELLVNSLNENDAHKRKRKKRKTSENELHQKAPDYDDGSYAQEKELISADVDKNLEINETESNQDLQHNKDSAMFTIIGEVKTTKKTVKRILPQWLANPTVISVDLDGKKSLVSELDYLDENTKNNLVRSQITHLFPVQAEVVPWLMQSNLKRLCVRPSDICVSAPTGSGKTLAFVLPIIQSLKERVVCQVRALVVLPVGDLAVQVFKVFQQFCKGTDLHVALVVGQRSFSQEQSSLVKKGIRGFLSLVDIIVATPGRLMDHISRTEGFTLEYLRYLVIDEADRMMEEIQQGFLKRVEKAIFKNVASSECCCFSVDSLHRKTVQAPSTPCAFGHISEPVQKLLFSATLSQDPERLHELSLFQPKLFTSVAKPKSASDSKVTETNIIGKYTTPKGLLEQYVICMSSVKPLVVNHLICEKNFKRVLCFTKSLESCHRLRLVLENLRDVKVREISSNLQPVQRKIILEQFSSGKVQILVCTDIMARGIDIENIDCVISYDAPDFIKTYVHRIGRTARAGREGCAITLLEDKEVRQFLRMLSQGGKLPAHPLEIDFDTMKSMEEQYKTALNAVSKAIAEEKRKKFLLKESASNVKIRKNKRCNNNVRNKRNFRNYPHN